MSFLLTSTLSILAIGADVPPDETAITVNSPEDLKDVPTVDLVTIYNRLVPSAPVKKFKDRQTAVDRTFKLMESEAQAPPREAEDTSDPGWNLGMEDSSTDTSPDEEETSTKEDNVAATATRGKRGATSNRKKGGKAPATRGTGKRGRTAGFAGAKLFRVGDENPCRTGGLRAQSWDLVKPQGITYEKYLEKGGRAQELAFNVRQGRVKVEFPKGNGKSDE